MTARTLPVPARTAEQSAALLSAVRSSPGGKWLVEHVDDSPYWLATARELNAEVNWQLDHFLQTSWSVDVPVLVDGQIEEGRVHLLSEFGAQMTSWHSDDNHIWFDDEEMSGPFPTVPTTEDLADHLAMLLEPEAGVLAQTLQQHHEHILAVPPLLTAAAANTTDPAAIAAVIEATLRERLR